MEKISFYKFFSIFILITCNFIELKSMSLLVSGTVGLAVAFGIKYYNECLVFKNFKNLERKCLAAATNTSEDYKEYDNIQIFLKTNPDSYHNQYLYNSKRHIIKKMDIYYDEYKDLRRFNYWLAYQSGYQRKINK